MAHGDGEELRAVPAHDDAKIAVGQKGRALVAAGYDQGGIDRLASQCLAKRIGYTELAPLVQWQAAAVGEAEVEVLRQQDFPPPAIITVPPHRLQEPACRHQSVRQAVPEIAPAIAVGIYRMFEKNRRHELYVPHGTGPGPFHLVGGYGAFINDA